MSFKDLFSRPLPQLDWIQVEASTYCNAACVYCPFTVFKDQWPKRHLELETFQKLLPYLPKTQLVHLQGWGEPLMNPDLLEMVRLAKAQGCQVGTTTNAILTTRKKLAALLELELDILAFSLAGVGQANDEIRKGTSLNQVFERIGTLNELKRTKQAKLPEVHIAYMLLRSGIEDIQRLPTLLEGRGIDQVVISTLDFIPHRSLADEVFTPAGDRLDELQECLESVAEEGRNKGVPIHYMIPGLKSNRYCTENIGKSLVVSVDGDVYPCVFIRLPFPEASPSEKDSPPAFTKLTLGNINDTPLPRIWRSKAYKKFRKSFITGDYYQPCVNCAKRRITTGAVEERPVLNDLFDLT